MNKTFNRKHSQWAWCYLMIAPMLIGFCVFTVYPISWAIRYAFFDYDGIEATFVGLDNFVRVFTRDPGYWGSLANTFILTFGKLAIELPLALFLAILLKNSLRGSGIFRTIFFMPNIISPAIMGLIFFFIFDTANGFVNNVLLEWSIASQPINWFGAKWTAMAVIAIVSIWQGFGINMLFFLSGIQGIPQDLYECAALDGAGKWKSFIHITLPMLAPTMRIIFMLAMIGTMQTTDLVLVLTNGQPAGKTEVIMTYIFKYFFSYGSGTSIPQFGYATACSLVLAVILGGFSGIYLKMTKKSTQID